jgi:hypothetical protein
MKTTITIEQFDNGISIVETDDEGNTQAMVSLDRNKQENIGAIIWEDIQHLMNAELKNKVKMEITFTAMD